MPLTRIKTITSHRGYAAFLAECSEEPVAWLARVQVEEIPSPYAYSPTVAILERNGQRVCTFETAHRRYEAYTVPAEMLTFATEEAAADWHMRYKRH